VSGFYLPLSFLLPSGKGGLRLASSHLSGEHGALTKPQRERGMGERKGVKPFNHFVKFDDGIELRCTGRYLPERMSF
jgi:hypothetical protein